MTTATSHIEYADRPTLRRADIQRVLKMLDKAQRKGINVSEAHEAMSRLTNTRQKFVKCNITGETIPSLDI